MGSPGFTDDGGGAVAGGQNDGVHDGLGAGRELFELEHAGRSVPKKTANKMRPSVLETTLVRVFFLPNQVRVKLRKVRLC